ncbi:hypothetical protein [Mycolicibacterium sp.]
MASETVLQCKWCAARLDGDGEHGCGRFAGLAEFDPASTQNADPVGRLW